MVCRVVPAFVPSSQREAGAIEGGVRQDPPILVNEADTLVFRYQPIQTGHGHLAEEAVVVGEGRDHDVPIRIA